MSNKVVIKKVLSYIGRYKIHLGLSMLMALVSVAGTLYVPVLVGNAIDRIIGTGIVELKEIVKILVEICAIIAAVALCQ